MVERELKFSVFVLVIIIVVVYFHVRFAQLTAYGENRISYEYVCVYV